MPWGETLTVKDVFDCVLPTVSDVMDCGYNESDLVYNWLNGTRYQIAFSSKDKEMIALGIHKNHIKFEFLRRKAGAGSTTASEAYDVSWRKVVFKGSNLVEEAMNGPDGSSGNGGSEGVSQSNTSAGNDAARSQAGGASADNQGGNFLANIWTLSKMLAGDNKGEQDSSRNKGGAQTAFDKLWYFDRICEVLLLDKEKHPRISVLPEPNDLTRRIYQEEDNGTVFRIEEEGNYDVDHFAGKDFKAYLTQSQAKGLETISKTVSVYKKIVPLHVAGWRTTERCTKNGFRERRSTAKR